MTTQPFALVEANFADGTYKFGLMWPLATEWSGRSIAACMASLAPFQASGRHGVLYG
ncbi:hypothetical protein GGQ73_000693 [Rhizobium skierniewicense]|uniref:Uncharacterized protein n=1 Tax=Rhizobium skierniewicense TaxID=984260 RepID=A0A7W6C2Z5_9HYPH|nr:hypothetical protein [Rhizobium skierniewicense]MBB3944768.1 hypothetical protein [Rhizobium skierniewicense]